MVREKSPELGEGDVPKPAFEVYGYRYRAVGPFYAAQN